MFKAALHTENGDLLNNKIFENYIPLNGNEIGINFFNLLKTNLIRLNVDLNTTDKFKEDDEIKFIIFNDFSKSTQNKFKKILNDLEIIKILIIWEPPVVISRLQKKVFISFLIISSFGIKD